MAEVYLTAEERDMTGKQKVKKIREKGYVPAVVYGKDIESKPLQINHEDLIEILHTSAGENVIVKLNIQQKEEKDSSEAKDTVNALIKEIQQDPITRDILHVDFSKVSLTEKIVVKVPIDTKGDPVGVTQENGVLEVPMWELEVECLPTDIPERITVDIEEMEIGDTLHVDDIEFPTGVEILDDPERTVVSVAPPREIEEEEEEEEEMELEEEMEEPEVIREKEREEEVEKGAEPGEETEEQE